MRSIVGAVVLLAVSGSLASAASRADVQGITYRDQGLKVIEEKCLNCHNSQRIDAAIEERRDMEKTLKAMEKKGVVLTDREKMVMGHFWKKNPLR